MVEKIQCAAGLDQLGAGPDDARRVGHVFQHFHAGDDVVSARAFSRGQLLGGDLPVIHLRRRIPADAACATASGASPMSMPVTLAPRCAIALGQDAAAAADVHHGVCRRAGERSSM